MTESEAIKILKKTVVMNAHKAQTARLIVNMGNAELRKLLE